MQEATTTFTMRLPKELKEAFEEAVKAYDITSSQQVRQWMRSFVENYQRQTAKARK